MKEADPEFHGEATSLQCGKELKIGMRRDASHLAGEDDSTKRKILTRSMTVMSISTRRLSEPSVNTLWRLKIILSEELPCLTKVPAYGVMCVIIIGLFCADRFKWCIAFSDFFF